jgi:hypothetical protein
MMTAGTAETTGMMTESERWRVVSHRTRVPVSNRDMALVPCSPLTVDYATH